MNKEISLKKFFIFLGAISLCEILLLCVIIPLIQNRKMAQEIEKYCPTSFCSEDNTICYNYALDGDTTVVTWHGDCSSYYK